MFLAIDPFNPRRRVAFAEQEQAERYAAQLEPQWQVKPADDPDVASFTGRPAAD